ncbi:arginase family protein [Labrys okinawensis]|uniref:arginase family protein n=1 Tax=Labrys okinawensis TaxID=346911 RepID=UPI0015E35F6E|nr:arginase family protein [Labrys okinawensis]
MTFVPACDLHRQGVEAVLDLFPEGSRLAICIDALDPALVPRVIGRAPGGLTYDQLVDLIKSAARRRRIGEMDLVELMPERVWMGSERRPSPRRSPRHLG